MASNQIEGSGQPGAPVQANVPQQVVYYMPHQQQQPPSYGQAIQQGYTPPQNVVITQQPQTVVVAQAEGTNQPPPQTQPQSRFPQDLYCSKCQRVCHYVEDLIDESSTIKFRIIPNTFRIDWH